MGIIDEAAKNGKKKKKKAKKTVSIPIPDDTKEALRRAADHIRMPMSRLMVIILEKALRKEGYL